MLLRRVFVCGLKPDAAVLPVFDEQKLRQNPDRQLLRRFSAEVQPDRRVDKVQRFLRHAAFFELGKQRLDLPAAGEHADIAGRFLQRRGQRLAVYRVVMPAEHEERACRKFGSQNVVFDMFYADKAIGKRNSLRNLVFCAVIEQ